MLDATACMLHLTRPGGGSTEATYSMYSTTPRQHPPTKNWLLFTKDNTNSYPCLHTVENSFQTYSTLQVTYIYVLHIQHHAYAKGSFHCARVLLVHDL